MAGSGATSIVSKIVGVSTPGGRGTWGATAGSDGAAWLIWPGHGIGGGTGGDATVGDVTVGGGRPTVGLARV